MKVKLSRITDDNDGLSDSYLIEWVEDEKNGIEVELPDAIVADWRETSKHLAELEAYLDEKALPQIEAEQERRWEQETIRDGRVPYSVRRQCREAFEQTMADTIFASLGEPIFDRLRIKDKADE